MRICHLRRLGYALSMLLLLNACTPLIIGGVATGVSALHDRRSAGTLVDDKTILLKALSVSQSDDNGKKRSNISVDVYNQRVLLTGQAADRQAISQFVQQVKEISQVRQVLNEVQVAAESTWSDAASAAYLTGKVKLALLDIDLEGFDPTRVLITSSLGTVYVMGLLTPEEMTQVTEKVRFVSGVKRVVRLFERYTP